MTTHDVDEALTLADKIVLLTARPGSVKAEFIVPREGPKDAAHEFEMLKQYISYALEFEVDRAFAEQEREPYSAGRMTP